MNFRDSKIITRFRSRILPTIRTPGDAICALRYDRVSFISFLRFVIRSQPAFTLPSQGAPVATLCPLIFVRVPNSPTGQVLEAGPDWPVLVDVDDWTQLTWVVRSGLDWSQASLYRRSHESRSGTRASARWE